MRNGLNMISVWFGAILILVVVTGALAFTFTDFMSERLYGTKRFFFVIMLFAYAVYRCFRVRAALRDNRNND